MLLAAVPLSSLRRACASLTDFRHDGSGNTHKNTAFPSAKRTRTALLGALCFVPSICVAGWVYVAEGEVQSASTLYDGGSIEDPTGPFRVTVRLPADYVPGTVFDASDEVAVDIRGPGHFSFFLAEPMEGEMPLDAGLGWFTQAPPDTDPLRMQGPGPFIWAMEFYCPVPTPGGCRGYSVTGELGEFRLLSEPTTLGTLGVLVLSAVLTGYRAKRRPQC